MTQLLLVDDDRSFAAAAAEALRREGLGVDVARSLYEARNVLARSSPDVVVLDRRLPDGDGLDFLGELRRKVPHATVLVVTAHGEIASAVEAVRSGATDYLVKPVELVELVLKAKRGGEARRIQERLAHAEAEISGRHRLIAPTSPRMAAVLDLLARVAKSPRSPVLLLGETGVGKEVLARHLHHLSAGDDAPFVHVNCAAVPESVFESELFGHERGAFTDARAARRGLIETANGGTLFLDEIGEMPLALQSKLLTFLDSGRFRRLGASNEHASSLRVVAATNRDLAARVKAQEFREDLFFRLNVFHVAIPPLRERREDVVPLASGLLAGLAVELGRKGTVLGPRAVERLQQYDFPGNVRELRNVLERALVLESGPELELDMLAPNAGSANDSSFAVHDGPITLDELEKRYTRHVLARMGGRRGDTAQALGISYPTFLKKLGDE